MAAGIEDILRIKVEKFCLEQRGFCDSIPRFSTETRAAEAFESIRSAYFPLLAEITAHLQTFDDGHGEIIASRVATYLQTTDVHAKLATAYKKAVTELDSRFPTACPETLLEMDPLRDHTPKTVVFYYSGKGDLFILGENLMTLNQFGMPTPISWEPESRIPLNLIADDLWSITIYVPPGQAGEYKITNSGSWSTGPNLKINAGTATEILTPSFADRHSICLPIKISNESYRFCILGEGKVKLDTGEVTTLSWDSPIDMQPLGSALWGADITPQGPVKYKICLVGLAGDLIWETGKDREIHLETPFDRLPTFDSLPEEVTLVKISPVKLKNEFLFQSKLRERHKVELKHKEAALGAGRAKAVVSEGLVFTDKEIIKHHEPSEFKPLSETPAAGAGAIASTEILKAKAIDGKWVIFQQGSTGCTAGASACLLMDIGKVPSGEVLKNRTTARLTQTQKDLTDQGVATIATPVRSVPSLADLKALLDANGSIALRICVDKTYGHAIVVDEISADLKLVRIRDPWHGWDITVSAEAFTTKWRDSVNDLNSRHIDDFLIQVDRSRL